MIIKWNGKGINVVPTVGPGKPEKDKVVLVPGNNEVNEADWAAARAHVKPELKNGLIVEVEAEVHEEIVEKEVDKPVKAKDPKTGEIVDKVEKEKVKEKKVTIKAKAFRRLDARKAEEIVKDTWSVDTLRIWEEKEHRDSVRAEIKNQIHRIVEHQEDRKKKLKREKGEEDK